MLLCLKTKSEKSRNKNHYIATRNAHACEKLNWERHEILQNDGRSY